MCALAVVKSTFDLIKHLSMFATLATASAASQRRLILFSSDECQMNIAQQISKLFPLGLILFADLLLAQSPAPSPPRFDLTSSSFKKGERLPDSTVSNTLGCHGPNKSPQLEWSNAPEGTKSFVLILDDFEVRGGDGFIHWAVYNIPATTNSLSENAGASEPDLAGGGRHAYNDLLKRNYSGPCPPEGPPHKYRFTVFAIDIAAVDDSGTPMTWRKLRFIIRDHILGQASLAGLRGH
jgi:Raf kinase inhibitor-like YbhB/YbcL family protein